MTETVDCVVIGAGVVGLACARALALAGREVLVLERHAAVGTETSSRNSEVIHAGIYYPTGSLKARLCVAGKRALYAYCQSRGIAHENCGKLIVATDVGQEQQLQALAQQARANGVELEWRSGAQVLAAEPNVRAVAGLWSPTTGIVDSHEFMLNLHGDLESAGGLVAFGAEVLALSSYRSELRVSTSDLELSCRLVVNSAGLFAPTLAQQLLPQTPPPRFALGHYYTYAGAPPFSTLVYPTPEPGGLGVHVTKDLAGQVKFGPDVHWIDAVDYSFAADEAALRDRFVAAISRYFPGVDRQRLQPGYTGIRPKLVGPGEPAGDFVIAGPAQHGVAGLINLLGIESPGLTSSLAIADRVVELAAANA